MVLCGKAKSPVFVLPDKMPLGQHFDKVWCVILETVIRFFSYFISLACFSDSHCYVLPNPFGIKCNIAYGFLEEFALAGG